MTRLVRLRNIPLDFDCDFFYLIRFCDFLLLIVIESYLLLNTYYYPSHLFPCLCNGYICFTFLSPVQYCGCTFIFTPFKNPWYYFPPADPVVNPSSQNRIPLCSNKQTLT